MTPRIDCDKNSKRFNRSRDSQLRHGAEWKSLCNASCDKIRGVDARRLSQVFHQLVICIYFSYRSNFNPKLKYLTLNIIGANREMKIIKNVAMNVQARVEVDVGDVIMHNYFIVLPAISRVIWMKQVFRLPAWKLSRVFHVFGNQTNYCAEAKTLLVNNLSTSTNVAHLETWKIHKFYELHESLSEECLRQYFEAKECVGWNFARGFHWEKNTLLLCSIIHSNLKQRNQN